MEMLSETIWYISWPIIIYISIKFVQLNLKHYTKMERLEELEEIHAKSETAKK